MALACLACQRRVEVRPPTIGDAVWRCYCKACDVTVVLASPRYDSAGVEIFWQRVRGEQLALPLVSPRPTRGL